MSLLRRTAVRRLLIGFLLVAALATGLWWNSNRPLNATEQNLVGVWETVDPAQTGTAIARLADRMSLSLYHQGEPGNWTWMPPHYEWVASARSFHARLPLAMPMPLSLDAWQYYAWRLWGDDGRSSCEIVSISGDEVVFRSRNGSQWTQRRSSDPQLIRRFEELKADRLR